MTKAGETAKRKLSESRGVNLPDIKIVQPRPSVLTFTDHTLTRSTDPPPTCSPIGHSVRFSEKLTSKDMADRGAVQGISLLNWKLFTFLKLNNDFVINSGFDKHIAVSKCRRVP